MSHTAEDIASHKLETALGACAGEHDLGWVSVMITTVLGWLSILLLILVSRLMTVL